MKKTIENLLQDFEGHHSNFQIENFIVKAEGDEWAQYKQCLREIDARYETVKTACEKLKTRKNYLQNFTIETEDDKIFYNIQVENYNKKLNSAKSTKRELKVLVDLAVKLKDKIGNITPQKRQQLEEKSWIAKGLKMAAADIITTGRISNQTFDFILSLPKKNQLEILGEISKSGPWTALGYDENDIKQIQGQREESKHAINQEAFNIINGKKR